MTAFRDLPIRRKLLLLTLAPTCAALLAGQRRVPDLGHRRTSPRHRGGRPRRSDACSPTAWPPSITFDRPEEVDEHAGRCSKSDLTSGLRVLYELDGTRFGDYRRDGEPAGCPQNPPEESLGWNTYEVRSVIAYENEQNGVFYLSRDLADVHRQLAVGAGTIVVLLVLAVGAALALARRMQRSISEPLLGLADTARRISTSRDYSLRAAPIARDEIGVVVRSFNDMLDHIADRTAELSKTNAELQREVDERKRVERDRVGGPRARARREPAEGRVPGHALPRAAHADERRARAGRGCCGRPDSDTATRDRGLESIERNARAQARLIEDLLEISRIVTGKLRLQVRDVDLAAIVDTAVDIVQPAALAKRLQLDAQIEARPALTAGDPDRLQQVVWNLLSNAVKFTPADGAVTVRLRCARTATSLTVQDTGPASSRSSCRTCSSRSGRRTAAPRASTAVWGSASRSPGSSSSCTAAPSRRAALETDQGATFEVFLPSVIEARQRRRDRLRTCRVSDESVDASLLRGVDVLVVDDDEDARLLLQMTLSQLRRGGDHGGVRRRGAGGDRSRRPRRRAQRHRHAARGRLRPASPPACAAAGAGRHDPGGGGDRVRVRRGSAVDRRPPGIRRTSPSRSSPATSRASCADCWPSTSPWRAATDRVTCRRQLVSCNVCAWRRSVPSTSPRTSICRKSTTR